VVGRSDPTVLLRGLHHVGLELTSYTLSTRIFHHPSSHACTKPSPFLPQDLGQMEAGMVTCLEGQGSFLLIVLAPLFLRLERPEL
jgi:hypothetical protein